MLRKDGGAGACDLKSALDFIDFLSEKLRRNKARQEKAVDMSEFDPFGAGYDGTFDRNACHDRPVCPHASDRGAPA